MKGIYWLMLIITAAWLLILLESYIFFAVIQPLGPPIHVGPLPSTLAKISGTIGLAVLWFVVTLSLRGQYLRSRRLKSPSGVS
jgi:hypothetical protein